MHQLMMINSYLASVALLQMLRFGSDVSHFCDELSLRSTNAAALVLLAYLALLYRNAIEGPTQASAAASQAGFSSYAVHTAINIALFPLLFFFSGLYYTDVASTLVVLGASLNQLSRERQAQPTILSDLSTISLGLTALFMRQTNVFWVVVFAGGLDAIRAVKTLQPQQSEVPDFKSLTERIRYFTLQYSTGAVHDPSLSVSWLDGRHLHI
jgi:alpha-1,2-glucosyltransferase